MLRQWSGHELVTDLLDSVDMRAVHCRRRHDLRIGATMTGHEVFLYGHTLLVQRRYGRWTWTVEFPDGSSIEGWTFSKRGAYRACFHAVPRG